MLAFTNSNIRLGLLTGTIYPTETRVMVHPTGPSTLHTDPQAVWHLGRTPNEVNRANQTTRNLASMRAAGSAIRVPARTR